jgi:thioredoxin reductase
MTTGNGICDIAIIGAGPTGMFGAFYAGLREILSSSVIPPGTRADLTVVFDLDYHDTEGPVTRVVWLETNDPDQPDVRSSYAP